MVAFLHEDFEYSKTEAGNETPVFSELMSTVTGDPDMGTATIRTGSSVVVLIETWMLFIPVERDFGVSIIS